MVKVDFKSMKEEELHEYTRTFLDANYKDGGIVRYMDAAEGIILGAITTGEYDLQDCQRIIDAVTGCILERSKATTDIEELKYIAKRLDELDEKKNTQKTNAMKELGIDPNAGLYDLLKIGIGLLDGHLEDGSCPPSVLENELKECIHVIVTCVDGATQGDTDELTEEQCDELMEKCAEYRKRLMAIQDRTNEEEYMFDKLLLNGYDADRKMDFNRMR